MGLHSVLGVTDERVLSKGILILQKIIYFRERIVIMSLLLGCDYAPGGVSGVGKDNLTKLFNLWGQPVKGELQKVPYSKSFNSSCMFFVEYVIG